MKHLMLATTLLVGLAIWFAPQPEGISEQAWHLFAVFIATIFGMVAKPLPMGAVAFCGLAVVVVANILPFEVAFSGFANESVWLIVFAFFVARGFIKTGLGSRLSYFFMYLIGKKTLGLGYAIVASDLLLAPAIPSSTARSGGVILPIIDALAETFHSKPHDASAGLMGNYLIIVAMQASCVTSAMFVTAMAANPLVIHIAAEHGIHITWASWALAASLPGIVSCILIPYLIFKLYPPGITESPHAPEMAKRNLAAMGKVSRDEWIMIGTFLMLIVLWVFAQDLNLKPAVSAMFGLMILLMTDVLTWEDIRKEASAWETLVWFAVLLMMAAQLGKLGFTSWVSTELVQQVQGFHWQIGFLILSLAYFYSHYLFASNLAHVGAMFAMFLGVAIGLGTPPMLATLVFAFFSSLFGALTQYSCGPAAILFGAGYVRISSWWLVGFVISVVNIAIWLVIGGLWWKVLGYY